MKVLEISWVREPSELPDQGSADDWRPFVDRVGEHLGVRIARLDGVLHEVAPHDGFIIFSEAARARPSIALCSAAQKASLFPRLIPIAVSRVRIFETLLEPLSIPAAIDTMSLMEWEPDEHGRGAWGLYGLREIGELAGARCSEIFQSRRYCYLESPTHDGLPHLLAAYLEALARQRQLL